GIRDGHVTGVQTCALPIFVFTADGAFCYRPGDVLILQNDGVRGDVEPDIFRGWFEAHGFRVESAPPNYRLDGGNLLRLEDGTVRSEERRVGKECRTRSGGW